MKKLLLASLCATALTLTACDKKPNENTTSKAENTATPAVVTSLSENVVADIRSDLDQIQTLSNAKAQEALKFQTDVTQAAQKGDKAALDTVVDHMKTYVGGFNDDLKSLALKSKEGDSLRGKMQESNNLGLELAQAGVKMPPDMTKITELQKKATDSQQALLQDMQALQAKITAK